ncbi:MAG: type IV toxin-antitoxin system AbiEi family antitoxin domain-containing protein [Sedimentisphaerales bacterium]
MKTIDWQKILHQQRDIYGKVVFTITELSNISSQDTKSLKVSLSRLVKSGVIQRYTKGRYGIADSVRIENLVSSIDPSAYVTGMSALYRHQLITQVPTEISCFTNHRHSRSRVRGTALGKIVFVCVAGSIYSYPQENAIVSPEQAIADFVYLCRKRGVCPSDIVTFRNLNRLDLNMFQKYLKKYPTTVKNEMKKLFQQSGIMLP